MRIKGIGTIVLVVVYLIATHGSNFDGKLTCDIASYVLLAVTIIRNVINYCSKKSQVDFGKNEKNKEVSGK